MSKVRQYALKKLHISLHWAFKEPVEGSMIQMITVADSGAGYETLALILSSLFYELISSLSSPAAIWKVLKWL